MPVQASPKASPLRLVAAAGATPFLDGYSTGSAAFLIIMIPGLSAWSTGLFTSLYYVGFALGAPVIGRLSDRFGRRAPFLLAMGALIPALLLSVLPQAWDGLLLLLASRLLCGVLLGGDYPVSQAIVTELAPEGARHRCLISLMLAWYLGAIAAVLLFLPISALGLSWRSYFWIEATLAALALAWRTGIPESPSWRRAPADDQPQAAPAARDCAACSPAETLRRFLFCAFFWSCQTIPVTVLMLYSSPILESLTGPGSAFTGVLLLYACFLAGVLPALHPALARNPKQLLTGTFLAMAVSLAAVAAAFCAPESAGRLGPLAAGAAFIVFALAYGLQTPLDFVIPNVLLPERARARLVGALTTIARVATMGSALLFPALAERLPLAILLLAGSAVLLAGAAASHWLTPGSPASGR